MEEILVCPLKIYTFTCSEDLLKEVSSEVVALEYRDTLNNLTSKEPYKNYNLLSWFDKCLEEVRLEKFPTIEKFTITNCWVTKTIPSRNHHQHAHPNSFLSGVFHVTSNNSGALEFQVEDKWYQSNHLLKLFDNNSFYSTTCLMPESGRLVIFPSSLKHRTSVLKLGSSIRYSVSFNSYPNGKINIDGKNNIATSIELHTKNVLEL